MTTTPERTGARIGADLAEALRGELEGTTIPVSVEDCRVNVGLLAGAPTKDRIERAEKALDDDHDQRSEPADEPPTHTERAAGLINVAPSENTKTACRGYCEEGDVPCEKSAGEYMCTRARGHKGNCIACSSDQHDLTGAFADGVAPRTREGLEYVAMRHYELATVMEKQRDDLRSVMGELRAEVDELTRQGYPSGVLMRILDGVAPQAPGAGSLPDSTFDGLLAGLEQARVLAGLSLECDVSPEQLTSLREILESTERIAERLAVTVTIPDREKVIDEAEELVELLSVGIATDQQSAARTVARLLVALAAAPLPDEAKISEVLREHLSLRISAAGVEMRSGTPEKSPRITRPN